MIRARVEQGLEPEWFTPSGQPDGEEPARFLLRPLTSPQIAEVEQELSRGGHGWKITARGYELLWQYGVAKLEGCQNHDGTPMTRIADALAWLPESVIVVVGMRALTNSRLGAHEKKASRAPSKSPANPNGSSAAAGDAAEGVATV